MYLHAGRAFRIINPRILRFNSAQGQSFILDYLEINSSFSNIRLSFLVFIKE